MEDTSRTLGEEDLVCTTSVRQNAGEDSTTVSSDAADTADVRTGSKPPWDSKHASFASLFAGNRKPDNGIKLQQMQVEDGPFKIDMDDVQNTDWNSCLVGYFGGRFSGKKALQQLVISWKKMPVYIFIQVDGSFSNLTIWMPEIRTFKGVHIWYLVGPFC